MSAWRLATERKKKKLPTHRPDGAWSWKNAWNSNVRSRTMLLPMLVIVQLFLLFLMIRTYRALHGKEVVRLGEKKDLPCKYEVEESTDAVIVQQQVDRPCPYVSADGRDLMQQVTQETLWLKDTQAKQSEDNMCRTPTPSDFERGKISIVVPVAQKDIDRAVLLKKSLEKFFDPNSLERIFVVCPDKEIVRVSLLFLDDKTTVIGEDQLLENGQMFKDMQHAQYLTQKGNRVVNEGGWVRQQAIKFAASKIVATDFYIVLDADNIAVRPMGYEDFVRDGRAAVNFDVDMRRNGQFKEWWRWARDVLGAGLWNATYGVTPGVMSTKVVHSLIDYIEERYGERWTQVLLNGTKPWTEWGLYYTFAETSGMFDSVHFACEGLLYSYVVWRRIDYQSFDRAALFSQSYSLFTIVQSIGNIPPSTVASDFEPYILSAEAPVRSDQEASWMAMRRLRDAAEDGATRRHLHRSDHTAGVDIPTEHVEAYACFVCSEEYALSAVVLAESIRRTGTNHRMVVFAPHSLIRGRIRALLEAVFDEFIEVAHISNPNFEKQYRERLLPDLMAMYPNWHPHDHQVHLYSKLNVFRLYKFSKIVYLDADTLVLKNIDELFHRPSLSAAPDVVPPDNFNTGVMVLKPSEQVMNAILGNINRVASYQGGDQGFLNSFFSCWFRMPVNFRLPYVYNIQSKLRAISTSTWARLWPDAKVLHFSPVKPWKDPKCTDPKYGDLHKLWWMQYSLLEARLSPYHQRTISDLVRRQK